jgi:hypothetical protein
VADAASIKRAFDIAFSGMLAAPDSDTFEAHLGHALGYLYRLYELAGAAAQQREEPNETLKASEEGWMHWLWHGPGSSAHAISFP